MPNEVVTHYRACNLCEAICGLAIKTQGGEIIAIEGDKLDPLSRGHICPKATALKDLHEDPDRLKRPVKRVGDGWRPISWDEAFDFVAENVARIQAAGGNDAVALYAGNPNMHNYGNITHAATIRRAIRTRNSYSATSLDQLPLHLAVFAMYGHQLLLPVPDIDHTHFMLIIGANPVASNGSMMTVPDVTKRLKSIQQGGGRFVVIDPRRTETAAIADRHHFIRPGTDAFLLLAMIHTLFEEQLVRTGHLSGLMEGVEDVRKAVGGITPELAAERTGIAAEDIRQLARDMALTDGAVCYGRMGVSVQSFGALCQWAIQTINILAGSLDARGGALVTLPAYGGYVLPGAKGSGHFDRWRSRVSGLPEWCSELPSAVMAEEILTPGEGQVRGLISLAGNPVLSAPNGREMDRALESLDFMAAVDIYINETTRHADVILPPTGPLEHDHYDWFFLRLGVHNTARYNEPVFERAPDARHDWQILNELSGRIAALKGEDFTPLPAPHVILDAALKAGPYGEVADADQSLSLEKLKQNPHGVDLGPLQPGQIARLCEESGWRIRLNIDFFLSDIARLHEASVEPAEDEFLLIGRRHVRSNNSWMHNFQRLVKGKPRWQLLMHPDDMAKYGLADDVKVKVSSRVGEVVTTIKGSDEVMPGVVSLPHGWGHQREGVQLGIASQQQGVSCNDLTDNSLFDAVSGNAAFNGVPVRVVSLD